MIAKSWNFYNYLHKLLTTPSSTSLEQMENENWWAAGCAVTS